jgi:hypothetical protein
MTLFDFQLNPIPEQVAILYQQGVYIGKRKEDELIVLLYQLESFYVEVIYRNYRRYVARIRCTASTSVLDPYLEQINVEDLVSS